MWKTVYVVLSAVAFALLLSTASWACSCGSCGHDSCGGETQMCGGQQTSAGVVTPGVTQQAVNVGNKICPVMGEEINEATKVTYEYAGKIYNLCCPGCINTFRKDPQKYIKG